MATILTSEGFRYVVLPIVLALLGIFAKRRAAATVRAGAPAARGRGRVQTHLEDASVWWELILANLAQLLLIAVDRQVALESISLPPELRSKYSAYVTAAPWLGVALMFLLWALADHVRANRQASSLRRRFLLAYLYPHVAAVLTLIFSFWFVSR